MKKLTQLFMTFALIFTFSFGLAPSFSNIATLGNDNDVSFESSENIVHAAPGVFEGTVDTDSGGSEASSLITKLKKFANVLAAVVLAISIIMFIVGGLRYILSNGQPQQVEQGKLIIMYSGIGIVIALSAFALGKLFSGFSF